MAAVSFRPGLRHYIRRPCGKVKGLFFGTSQSPFPELCGLGLDRKMKHAREPIRIAPLAVAPRQLVQIQRQVFFADVVELAVNRPLHNRPDFTPPHRFEMGNARFLGGPAAVDVDYAGHGSHAKQRERIGQGVRDLADDLGAQRRGLRANGQRVGRVEPHALRAGGIRSEMTIVANLASGSAGTCPEELEHRLAHVPDWDLAGAGEVVDCVCAGHLGSPDLAGGDCPSGDLECKVHNSDRFRQARRLQ